MFTAKTGIDLPHPPDNLVEMIRTTAHDDQKPFLTYPAGEGLFECKPINRQVLWWAGKVLPVFLRGVCIQTVRAGDFDAHVDGPIANGPPRDYNLMYIIDAGGDCVTTNFYKTTEELIKLSGVTRVLPLEHREKIASYEFKPGEWILMNNQCFHSVNGITGLRIGLSISLFKIHMTPELKVYINE